MQADFTMQCPDCDTTVGVRKSLQRGKSAHPDECPECGAELEKSKNKSRNLLEK